MPYIKIKVKHLLILTGITLVLLVSLIYFRGDVVYVLGKAFEAAGDTGRANVYYDRASKDNPDSGSAVRAAMDRLELLIKERALRYFAKITTDGSGGVMGGIAISPASAGEIYGQYQEFLQRHRKNDTFAEYAMSVAMVCYFAGRGDQALEILNSIDYIRDSRLKEMHKLHTASVYMGLGETERGMEVIRQDLEKQDVFSPLRSDIHKYFCFISGDWEGFRKIKREDTWWYQSSRGLKEAWIRPFEGVHNMLWGYGDIVEKHAGRSQGGNTFTGTVMADGKPVAHAVVFLKTAASKGGMSDPISMSNGVTAVAVTDSKGRYRMEGVPNGVYGIGISIDSIRVAGKGILMHRPFDMKFTGNTQKNEDIALVDTSGMVKMTDLGEGRLRFDLHFPAGADHVSLTMGEVTETKNHVEIAHYTYYSGIIRSTSWIVDIKQARRKGYTAGASYSSPDGVDPHYLMEPFYHTGEYSWHAYAYDNEGNILLSSEGLFPMKEKEKVHIEGNEWMQADKLLLDRKFEEAIALYEKQAEENSRDLHSVKVLAKLYANGWKYDSKKEGLLGKDPVKAIRYLERLDEEIKDNDQIINSLAMLHIDQGEMEKALRVLEEPGRSGTDQYAYYLIGRINGYLGRFTAAEENYCKYQDSTGYGSDYLIMLYVLQNREEKLKEAAGQFDNRIYYVDYVRLVDDYLKMDRNRYEDFFRLIRNEQVEEAERSIAGDNGDLVLLYKGVLLLQKHIPDYKDRETFYSKLYEKVKDPRVKELMKAFGKAGIQSGFGDY